MKYLFLIYGAEDAWTPDERAACIAESMGVCDELAAAGKYLDAAPLEPSATAVTVRVRDGKPLVTDGPFAETTEQLGGFYALDLADLDEAIAVAAKLPPAAKGTVEIRPLLTLDGLPPATASHDRPGEPLYLFACHDDAAAWAALGPDALPAAMAEATALCRELAAAGRYLSASPLHPPATATCVRVRGGKRVITDGPFAETNEVIGGYYLIRADSVEAAAAIAARHPGARLSAVEVRRVFDTSGFRKIRPNP